MIPVEGIRFPDWTSISLDFKTAADLGVMSSIIEIETSPLLAGSNTDAAKRIQDEAKSALQQKYPTLIDMAAQDILKVFGAMRESRLEIAELCISTSFPLVIIQYRSLTNLLTSLSTFDDQERWLSDKVGDLKRNVARIQPIYLSVKEAFVQIDRMAGTSLAVLLSEIEEAFDMFETEFAECVAKAKELRVEQKRSKHLSPLFSSPGAESWSSGSNIPSSGIVQRTSFGRDGYSTEAHVENGSAKPKGRRLTKLRHHFTINPEGDENHWTSFFGLDKLPVILILVAAMPPLGGKK
ncbi:hypothetical protein FPANT_11835 [Fusarium pseudoanthophilum]|uniref:Uncharacterized protein n=1 Tax=Fusarium pseudoanthophilum TaxID=48495 RepID=A0A8H5KJ99_9HYPO|nr:hypothetical protein FPANT_11835 [Fusarium pseudoanthophilum]